MGQERARKRTWAETLVELDPEQGGRIMAMHLACAGSHGEASPAGAVMATAAAGASGSTSLGERAQTARASATGVPAIDIHAHYYPQGYFDVINAEGARFNAHFKTDGETFSFKTPAASNGGLPMKFIDLQQRLAEMDDQG